MVRERSAPPHTTEPGRCPAQSTRLFGLLSPSGMTDTPKSRSTLAKTGERTKCSKRSPRAGALRLSRTSARGPRCDALAHAAVRISCSRPRRGPPEHLDGPSAVGLPASLPIEAAPSFRLPLCPSRSSKTAARPPVQHLGPTLGKLAGGHRSPGGASPPPPRRAESRRRARPFASAFDHGATLRTMASQIADALPARRFPIEGSIGERLEEEEAAARRVDLAGFEASGALRSRAASSKRGEARHLPAPRAVPGAPER